MKLEPTGERMIQEHYRSTPEDHVIYLMHEATYRFAERFAQGKRVLDDGCGSGYGSAQLARVARHVMAVDVAADAIAHATEAFQAENLRYMVVDPDQALPFADESFDLVVSFQVFEHVEDTQRYLSQITRVLSRDGVLLLATPDRSTRLLPFQRPWNRFHLHEYSHAELAAALAQHFGEVEVLGMGGTKEAIDVELRRSKKVKWLTLPLTMPFFPDRVRVAGLNLLHKMRGAKARTGQAVPCQFTVEDIVIAQDIAPSVNLVAIASRPKKDAS